MKRNIRDISRGSGNRVAVGASLLGEGNSPADHAHVSRAAPLQTKMKELENDPRYVTELVPDTNKAREKRTTAMRRAKDTRPL
jgi:hypothetical protein